MSTPDPLIIGLCGLAGTGKDTAAHHLCDVHGFERYAFADPMRDMLEALFAPTGLDHAYLHEPKLKDQPVPGLGFSYRHLMQTLGTEWARQQLAPDFWLRIAEMRLGLPYAPVHDRIVITDVRLPAEAAWINQRHGAIVRLERPTAAPVRAHVTEQGQALIEPWQVIENTDGIQWLHWQLDAIVERLETGER